MHRIGREVLGKAYDARLMRRLLGYLRPYRAAGGAAPSPPSSATRSLQLAPPYLTKVVIDTLHSGRRSVRPGAPSPRCISLTLIASFAFEYAQTWTMQMTGQRMMFDLRMQVFSHLQRLDLRFYDRNPVGRLMTRVTTDVDVLNELFTVRRRVDVRRRLHADRHHGRAGVDGLAAGAGRVLRAAADRARSRSGSARTCASPIGRCALWIARINAYLQERITGMATVQLFRREARDFAAFDEIDRAHRDANVESIFYYAVFYPAVELVSALAASLIIWYGGGRVMPATR